MKKKLIEAMLPLATINDASAREKSIRHGHPSTLHLWWARRPLAAARAVLFASLVDDPSAQPELYPTEDDQAFKRAKLFKLIGDLVQWENSSDPNVLARARAEIIRSTEGNPPEVLDPFAGGGTIPLEAQRLGLRAHAADLNPVAVLINKAVIEIPARFKDRPPVNPSTSRLIDESRSFLGARGLAADVEYYGRRLKALAFERIGALYPTVRLEDGSSANVIAWIWARTVKCSNPACGCTMPLVHSFVLSKKQNASVRPLVDGDRFRFEIEFGGKPVEGTITKKGARCIFCGADVKFEHIRAEGKAGRLGAQLMAIVAEGKKSRVYLAPNEEHEHAAEVDKPEDYPDADLPNNPRDFKTPNYGMRTFAELFTNRQLTALTTFSDLIEEVRAEVIADCGEKKYADAIAVYLAFLVDKLSDRNSTICGWDGTRDGIRNTFGRQAIPMSWDYVEGNPFSSSSGCFDNMLDWIVKCVRELPTTVEGEARQHDALQPLPFKNMLISSDPPYYDNISYADLSDFFYIWLRRSIRRLYPQLFLTMNTPKEEELISSPYRQGGKDSARDFFETNIRVALKNIYDAATTEYPITIYYAYKQGDDYMRETKLSAGWETMLKAIVEAGFIINSMWPIRTEMMTRSIARDSNALSTSIVIVCRKPPEPKPSCTYPEFTRYLRTELPPRLRFLQKASNLSPVDMAQASIGPGMEIYSRYAGVLRSDGSRVDIRSALRLINKALDEFLNNQDDGLDDETKFCALIYAQAGFEPIEFGQAQVLATSKNISITKLSRDGIAEADGGKFRLIEREHLPKKPFGCQWSMLQRVIWLREDEGLESCAEIIFEWHGDRTALKMLAYRLYNIADRKKNSDEALVYGELIEAWEYLERYLEKEQQRKDKEQMSFENMR